MYDFHSCYSIEGIANIFKLAELCPGSGREGSACLPKLQLKAATADRVTLLNSLPRKKTMCKAEAISTSGIPDCRLITKCIPPQTSDETADITTEARQNCENHALCRIGKVWQNEYLRVKPIHALKRKFSSKGHPPFCRYTVQISNLNDTNFKTNFKGRQIVKLSEVRSNEVDYNSQYGNQVLSRI